MSPDEAEADARELAELDAKTAESTGVGYAYAGHESHGITTGDGVYLAKLAGIEILDERDRDAFAMLHAGDSRLVDWKAIRDEYRARTGRQFPRAYRFVLRLEAVELTDNEARAYWQGEGDKSRIRKSTPQRDIATE